MTIGRHDLWNVAIVLLGMALWSSGPGDLETAHACPVTALEDEPVVEHQEKMLAACHRELAYANILADDAIRLVDQAQSNFHQLVDRCAGNARLHMLAGLSATQRSLPREIGGD